MKENNLVNVEDEIFNINSKMIFEYSKVVENLVIEDIKVLKFKDGDKTICFLFYGSDFFAYNRVNFADGHNYDKEKDFLGVSENLNNKIRKIPNVAKTRGILKIDDIEARIYDMSEYILILTKENMKVFRVRENGSLDSLEFELKNIDSEKIGEKLKEYELEEAERVKEEKSFRNKFGLLKDKLVSCIVEPLRLIKSKILRTNDVKLLGEGNSSIFDK